MTRVDRWSALALVLCVSACGSDNGAGEADIAMDVPVVDVPGDATPDAEVPTGPIVDPVCDPEGLALGGTPIPIDDFFKPPDEVLPFPNLARTTPDGGAPNGFRPAFNLNAFAPVLNVLDGFGSAAPFVVPLTTAPHQDSLTDGSVFLVRTDGADDPDLDPDRLVKARVPVEVAFNDDAGSLVVEPLVPLEEGGRFALVVTRCMKDADGNPVDRAPAMEALDGTDKAVSPLVVEINRARRFLDRWDVNLPEEAVALVLPTVVRSTTSRLRGLVAAADKAGGFDPVIEWAMVPALPDGNLDPAFLAKYAGLAEFIEDEIGVDEAPLHFYDAIGLAAQGHFTVKRYLDPEQWAYLESGEAPEPIEEHPVKFFMTIPKEDPASGRVQPFPVVVFQHAFGVCKETAIGLAGTFSRLGLATIGIDAVAHGHRTKGGDWSCALDPMTFLTLGEPMRLWYNFAESALDLAQLAIMVRDLDLDTYPLPDGDGKPDVKGDVVGISGQSMGAFLSATTMGLYDGIGPAVINVGGGQEGLFFGWNMVSSTGQDPLTLSFSNLPGLILNMMAPAQMAFDDVEPISFAQGMFDKDGPANRQVLIQQAMQDDAVAGACLFRLARALGIPRMTPGFYAFDGLEDAPAPLKANLEGGRTGALAQFSPAEHAFLLTNHGAKDDPYLVVRSQVQAAFFMRSFFDDGVSTIINPYDEKVLAPYLPEE